MTSVDRSSDKNLILNAFNTQLFEFIDEVQTVFTEDTSISKVKTALYIIKKVNPSLIIKIWYTYIYSPYKTEITNDNINFFIEKDYKNDVVYLKCSDDIVNNIDKLRNPIRNMGKENQEKSFKYVKNLCILSQLYSEE
jgi:hypothetical protein